MLSIRMRRTGSKKRPFFRVVVSEARSKKEGEFIEVLGFYNPRTHPTTLSFKEERIYDWMSKGAQPSDSVAQLFASSGLTDRYARFKKGEAVETLLAEAPQTMGGKFAPADQSGLKTRID